MGCNNTNHLEYYQGDNNSITVTVANDDGTRIDGLNVSLSDVIFQAVDSDGNTVLDLRYLATQSIVSTISYAVVDGADVFTIQPRIADMNIAVGTYDIYMKLVLTGPDRNHHVKMFTDGVQLTKLKILDGGAS